ncbi:metal-dependent phosphohydrolase [Nonomuraea sp. NPDC050663]|uniref:metal-dependent phosphohydrolase n=1 Tax=Nonomuraea sp. NPDC050663 TaxID=3364370 RepID=UPI00379BC696
MIELLGDRPAVRSLRAELLARWSEPHRRYHTRDHLDQVLAALDELTAADGVAVRLAAWFHDAVYDGRPGSDEERSAQLAQQRLPSCGVPAATVAEVARLVRLTVNHDPAEDDLNGQVLCDADLSILASDARRYAVYAGEIRQEYRHVPDELFRAGRAQVLGRLLSAPRLFRTERAHARWEGPARANMERELAALAVPQS